VGSSNLGEGERYDSGRAPQVAGGRVKRTKVRRAQMPVAKKRARGGCRIATDIGKEGEKDEREAGRG